MNILLLPSWYPTKENPLSGIFFKEQAHALYNEGIKVSVLCLNVFSMKEFFAFLQVKKRDFYDDNGIKTYVINYLNIFPKIKILFYYYSVRKLRKFFCFVQKENQMPFDLVHIHSAFSLGIIYYLSKIPVPYIVTEHSTLYSRNQVSCWEKKFLPQFFSSAKDIIAVSNGLKQHMKEYTNKEIKVIYNLVSMERFACQIDNKRTKFRFFSLGMNSHKKGFDILITAYSKMVMRELTELYIAGLDKDEMSKIQKMIEFFQFENVTLFGKISREEVAYNMCNCDCFVLPSRFETFGVVFAEAMFFGKPVIASQTGGPDSFVTPETGILVSVENIEETAKALDRMYLDRKSYNSEYISQYAEENFSGEKVAKKIIQVYTDLIHQGKSL